jgi:hypothetical protein
VRRFLPTRFRCTQVRRQAFALKLSRRGEGTCIRRAFRLCIGWEDGAGNNLVLLHCWRRCVHGCWKIHGATSTEEGESPQDEGLMLCSTWNPESSRHATPGWLWFGGKSEEQFEIYRIQEDKTKNHPFPRYQSSMPMNLSNPTPTP